MRNQKKIFWDNKSSELRNLLNDIEGKRLDEMEKPGANSWINCIPVIWKPLYLLPKSEFQDALLLRFNKMPSDIPSICPSNDCQEPFSLVHSDICLKGGVIHRRHDYVKLILGKHAEHAYGRSSVMIEPLLGPLDNEAKDILSGNCSNNARADLAIRDFKGIHSSTYIDISVVSPVCDSYKELSVTKVIANAEKKKMTIIWKESKNI